MKTGSFLIDNAGFSELSDMIDSLGLSQGHSIGKQWDYCPKYRALYLDQLFKKVRQCRL